MKVKRFFSFVLAAIAATMMMPGPASAADSVLPDDVTEWTGNNTVYYNGQYYETLGAALTAVYQSTPQKTAEVYCKPGADVGKMTHAHVADDITIYGNGAKVSGGEYDLEVDTYKYSRITGKQDPNGAFLEKDITITVKDLDGIAAWGQRNTEHAVTLIFENCQNMNRVYISGKTGKNNYTLKNCSFDSTKGSHSNTSIYSNAQGKVEISNCAFVGVVVPINLNNKSAGVQTIAVANCSFTDCSVAEKAAAANAATYAAPIRILAQEGAASNLSVTQAVFLYTGENKQSGNGDILLGDGRHGEPEVMGTVTLSMEKTEATIQVQTAGYYGADQTVANPEHTKSTEVTVNDKVTADTEKHFTVSCAHPELKKTDKVDATCTKPGNIAYWTCSICGKLFQDENGVTEIELEKTVIPATGHTASGWKYDADSHWKECTALGCEAVISDSKQSHIDADKDGKCDICGYKISSLPIDSDNSDTGVNSNLFLWLSLLLISGVVLFAQTVSNRKSIKTNKK